jgi:hypothetical protein
MTTKPTQRTKSLTTRLGCLAAVFALAGCGNEPSGPAPPRVALVMKSLANEFFKTMEDGARSHQAASGGRYELLASGIRDGGRSTCLTSTADTLTPHGSVCASMISWSCALS